METQKKTFEHIMKFYQALKFSSDCGQLRQYSGPDLSEVGGFNHYIIKYCIEIESGGMQQD